MMIIVTGRAGRLVQPPTIFRTPHDWDNQAVADTWGQPLTQSGQDIYRGRVWMRTASDATLLSVMWNSGGLDFLDSMALGAGGLKTQLEQHYRENTGHELTIRLSDDYWNTYFVNNRRGILDDISVRIQDTVGRRPQATISFIGADVSDILRKYRISFRADAFNASLAIAMGGVQEVSIRSTSSRLVERVPAITGLHHPVIIRLQ